MKSRAAKKPQEPAAEPAAQPNQINITDHIEKLRECAAKTGRTVGDFIIDLIREGTDKLDSVYLTNIPCPFCARANNLDIINWSQERPDLTEYEGEAVRCNNCDAIAPVAAWSKRGDGRAAIAAKQQREAAACKGGAA